MNRIQTYIQNKPRRSIIIFLSIIMLVFISTQVFHFVTTGSVSVTTNDQTNQIEIFSQSDSKLVATKTGDLSTRLNAGDYVVRVSNKQATSKRRIEVIAKQSQDYEIDLRQPVIAQPVMPNGASSAVIGSSVIYYIDTAKQQLYKLGIDGVPTLLNDSVSFATIKWQDENFGVGINTDEDQLYAIHGDSIKPLNLPFQNKRVFYDLAPDGHLVVSDGSTVYLQSAGGTFKPIYKSKNKVQSLGISNAHILILAKDASESGDDETNAKIVDNQGKIVADQSGFSAYSFNWSPDGKLIAVTSDSSTKIYNLNLDKQYELSDPNLLSMKWQNSSTLLYGSSNQLFSHDFANDSSTLIATTKLGTGISDIFISQDNTQVYILVSDGDNSDNFSFSRVGLSAVARSTPDYYLTLGIFFPSQNGVCKFSYTNFINPVILITSWVDKDACIASAKAELKADDLPVKELQIRFQTSESD